MKKYIYVAVLFVVLSTVAIAAESNYSYQNRMPFYGNYNNYNGKVIQNFGEKYHKMYGQHPPMYGNVPPKDGYGMMPPQMLYGQKPPMYGNKPPKDGYGMMPPPMMYGMYGSMPPMYGNVPPKGGYGMMPPQMMYGQKMPAYGNNRFKLNNSLKNAK